MEKENLFSKRITELRKKHGYSQDDLAYLLGMVQPTVLKWENGKITNPNSDAVIKLANLFNCSTDYVLGLTKNPKRYE